MFGPLPTLHRFVLVLAALVVCVGIGFWLGAMPDVPLNLRAGLLAGTAIGVGAALMQQAELLARQAGAVSLTLETAHDNVGAQRLYERQGYRVDDRYRHYAKPLD